MRECQRPVILVHEKNYKTKYMTNADRKYVCSLTIIDLLCFVVSFNKK